MERAYGEVCHLYDHHSLLDIHTFIKALLKIMTERSQRTNLQLKRKINVHQSVSSQIMIKT